MGAWESLVGVALGGAIALAGTILADALRARRQFVKELVEMYDRVLRLIAPDFLDADDIHRGIQAWDAHAAEAQSVAALRGAPEDVRRLLGEYRVAVVTWAVKHRLDLEEQRKVNEKMAELHTAIEAHISRVRMARWWRRGTR